MVENSTSCYAIHLDIFDCGFDFGGLRTSDGKLTRAFKFKFLSVLVMYPSTKGIMSRHSSNKTRGPKRAYRIQWPFILYPKMTSFYFIIYPMTSLLIDKPESKSNFDSGMYLKLYVPRQLLEDLSWSTWFRKSPWKFPWGRCPKSKWTAGGRTWCVVVVVARGRTWGRPPYSRRTLVKMDIRFWEIGSGP